MTSQDKLDLFEDALMAWARSEDNNETEDTTEQAEAA
jgi:hypothetical protein